MGSFVAHRARAALAAETGFRSSAGVAHNKLLAKLVSGLHKPDDQTAIAAAAAAAFVCPLPVRLSAAMILPTRGASGQRLGKRFLPFQRRPGLNKGPTCQIRLICLNRA